MTNGASIRTTDYLDGFQYNQLLLEFFPHAEGYVKATNTGFTPGNPNYAFNYVYNYTDHLGNVRLSYAKDPQTGNLKILDETEERGSRTPKKRRSHKTNNSEQSHYYPFGLKHQEYQANGFTTNPIQGVIIAPVANNPYKYKYNGKELQDELDLNVYAYGWRDYDPAIGRFSKIDRFAEKYGNITPYSYAANNPNYFTDVKGDSINIAQLIQYDKDNGTSIVQSIINDLNTITGMTFKESGGFLDYEKDADGNAIISLDKEGNQTGSSEARLILSFAINSKETANARIGNKSEVTDKNGIQTLGGNFINISPTEINNFIEGSHGVDNRTMGFGMVFTHEILHTNVAEGGAKADINDMEFRGPVVNRMNTVRSQLNSQGYNFGQRSYYPARINGSGTSATIQMTGWQYDHLIQPDSYGNFWGPRVTFPIN